MFRKFMISAACDFARADWWTPIARHGVTVVAGLLCFFAGLPAARIGGAVDLPDTDHTQLRLIAAQAATGKDSELQLGLHFRLDPGWKIYWRTPGDAGIPPVFDWSDSRNVAKTTVEWQIPKRFSFYGLETFDYEDEVVLPVRVRLARSGDFSPAIYI